MKKPWSISTTIRNPYRLRAILQLIKEKLVGSIWNEESQICFQILMIQHRLYGCSEEKGFSNQFLNRLNEKQVEIFINFSHSLTFQEAKSIFDTKNYIDPAMRGRQSLNPLKKLGFVRLRKKIIEITPLGESFLTDDFNIGEIFFKIFLKWQIPNPDSSDYKIEEGYDIKPFICILHLIEKVNKKSSQLGKKTKGISKEEFSLFGPTLVNYKNIDSYAEKIIFIRLKTEGKSKSEQKAILDDYKVNFAKEFLQSQHIKKVKEFLKNLKDYGDNAIRYFRLTRYIYIRGGGFYIDLEPRRSIEIENLLNFDNAKSNIFDSKEKYLDYISDSYSLKLPWETKEKYIQIIIRLLKEIKDYENKLREPNKEILDYKTFQEETLKEYIEELRKYRRELQEKENYKKSQDIQELNEYIKTFENIFKFQDRSILLEKLCSLGLNALNDALKIKPNYPVGDDNEPTFTAPANIPDIECFYEKYNAICEVTMLMGA